MSKSIVPRRREKSGRPQRLTTAQRLSEIAAEERRKVVGVVTAQPHRAGTEDPESHLLGSAIGRFVLRHRMAKEIVTAGEQYGTTKRKWRAAIEAPTDQRYGGSGGDVDEAKVRKWLREFREIENAIAGVAGMNALSWIEGACVRDMDIPENIHCDAIRRGLVELGYATGNLERPKIRVDGAA